MKIDIDKISIDGGTQIRVAINEGHVAELVDHVGDLPPATVFYDGSDYWLADGFHRFFASKRAGETTLTCEVKKGTKTDAILYACGANAKHGLKRTAADRRQAVLTAKKIRPDESNRLIADRCHVSEFSVRSIITECSESTAIKSQSSEHCVGKDGRKINTASIGKPKSPEPVEETLEIDPNSIPDFGPLAEQAAPPIPERLAPEKGTVYYDQIGNAIPGDCGHLIPVFTDGVAAYKAAKHHVSRIYSMIEAVAKGPGGALFSNAGMQQVDAETASIRMALDCFEPYAVCPYCGGRKCNKCKLMGFMGKQTYERGVAPEIKHAAGHKAA